eukprot:GHVS01001683.1.p3 GENE.GHVS01001683.1~~GHVS01001683.1.p3  ORF type:complete len:107 (+),score=9.23 GHVS01001683.1:907-1227(+)
MYVRRAYLTEYNCEPNEEPHPVTVANTHNMYEHVYVQCSSSIRAELCVFEKSSKYVEFVVCFASVYHVEDLHPNKRVENKSEVPTGTDVLLTCNGHTYAHIRSTCT